MLLDADLGRKTLQRITACYDDRHWDKKIEKRLKLLQSGLGDQTQQQSFMYLKVGLKAYKSREYSMVPGTVFIGPGDRRNHFGRGGTARGAITHGTHAMK